MIESKQRFNRWLLISLAIVISFIFFGYLFVILYSRSVNWSEDVEVAFTFISPVHWYGIFIFFGFGCAIALSCLKLYKYKAPIEPLYFFCIIAVPSAIIGARIGSCIIGQTLWSEILIEPGRGLAIEWGVLFVVLVALIYFPLVLRNRKYFVKDESNPNNFIARQVSMWIYVDSVLPTIFIGQILGRFGNYFNHEIYGAATTNEGMINFLKTFFPWMYINSQWHLPVFFFEQIGNIVGLFLIYFCCELITNKKIRKCGSIGIMYFIWYGLLRLWMTYLRKDGGGSGGEDVNFITTILWIVFGFLLLLLNTFVFYKYTRNKRIIWFFFYSLKTLFSNQTKAMKQQRTSYAKANFLKKSEQMFWYNNY